MGKPRPRDTCAGVSSTAAARIVLPVAARGMLPLECEGGAMGIAAADDRSAAVLRPSAIAFFRFCALSAAFSAMKADTAELFVMRSASAMAPSRARCRSAAVANRLAAVIPSAFMITPVTGCGTDDGSGSGPCPVRSRMSVATSFSPSQGALPDRR